MNTLLSFSAKYCRVPDLVNGNVTLQSGNQASGVVPIGSRLHYICHRGFSLTSANTFVQCINDGILYPSTPPVCSGTCNVFSLPAVSAVYMSIARSKRTKSLNFQPVIT